MIAPTVTERSRDGHQVVEIAGELDFTAVDAVSARLEPLLQRVARAFIVDLSQTTFLDSAGIKLLYDIHGALTARGQALRIVVPPENLVRRTLELTGTTRSFSIHADLDSAAGDSATDSGT